MDKGNTLIVRRLPSDLNADEQKDLLRHFGAEYVHSFGPKGRMRNVAFATFASHSDAANALRRLHQLDVLGSRLVVEFSSSKYSDFHPTELTPLKNFTKSDGDSDKDSKKIDDLEDCATEEDKKQNILKKIHAVSSKWGIDYPLDPRLQYAYPAPTITILTNIANAMAAVPRFYVQVLHLMNKMNLPAPFGLPTLTPPIPLGVQPPQPPETHVPAPPMPEEDMDFSSSTESEIESGGENKMKPLNEMKKRARKRERHYASRKRLRLQIQMQSQMQSITSATPSRFAVTQQPGDVFEQPQQSTVGVKRIEIKKFVDEVAKPGAIYTDTIQPSGKLDADKNTEAVVGSGQSHVVVEGGFGKIQARPVEVEQDDVEDDDDFISQGFISLQALQNERLSEKEMRELDVFKNYDPGEPTTRLYIKNLNKKVTEKDLRFIYGRYVNWSDELERSMFYVQLLTGRMKGQAFITLPNDSIAKQALSETNGYQLESKAMVVQFARSVKPKESK